MTTSDDKKEPSAMTSNSLPVIALKNVVVFPDTVVSLFIGRSHSIASLEQAMDEKSDSKVVLVAQRDGKIETPETKDLHTTGTVCKILQIVKTPDKTIKALFEGIERVKIKRLTRTSKGSTSPEADFFMAEVQPVADFSPSDRENEITILCRNIKNSFHSYTQYSKKIPHEILDNLLQTQGSGKLADTITTYLNLSVSNRQIILEESNILLRLEKVLGFIEGEIETFNVEKRIRNRVKAQMEKYQKDYYLNEQLRAIHKELGNVDEQGNSEIETLEAKIEAANMSPEAKEKSIAEVKKLKNMNFMSSETVVIRNHLDWLLSLPWSTDETIDVNLLDAQKELDRNHYGIEKVKERIIEYLAVQQRIQSIRGSILCLVGPPGVGKTSLARSIASATGRKFVKISLGGVRDESEIRGHRRTYIGAMPGKIVQGFKKAKVTNPVFLLDEIDKMGSDFRGDPASALLEVLDVEQNQFFVDHYLEVEYDISNAMFIATANNLGTLSRPLLDRMEIIHLSSYTEHEKLEIAQQYILQKQIESHGVKDGELTISKQAIQRLIRNYTQEAGVRTLEKQIAKIARKVVKAILLNHIKSAHVNTRNLQKYCGAPPYTYGKKEQNNAIGICTGMAYTEFGGELLTIEVVSMQSPGNSTIKATGKLGEVMQESVKTAYSYIRANAARYGLTEKSFSDRKVHVHVPEGATPKDGPSAGIAICTAILSMLTKRLVRCTVAMTGEITLRGQVLPIGGLREKLLAAARGGIEVAIIPKANQWNLDDIPDIITKTLKIHLVSTADEALEVALEQLPLGNTKPSE